MTATVELTLEEIDGLRGFLWSTFESTCAKGQPPADCEPWEFFAYAKLEAARQKAQP